jgi:choice-of-anchor C domain-containing protein
MRWVHVCAVAFVVFVALFAPAARAGVINLVGNGSFEDPHIGDAGGTGFTVVIAGQSIGPWVVDQENVDLVGSGGIFGWQHVAGLQSIDMAGSPGAGAIRQDLATTPGERYRLRFALSGNPVSNIPTVKAVDVYWNGALVDTPTFDITGRSSQDMGWRYLEYDLPAATADVTRLRFVSPIGTDGGAVIDDVSVTVVPEPGACLSIAVAGAWAMCARRRRCQ